MFVVICEGMLNLPLTIKQLAFLRNLLESRNK